MKITDKTQIELIRKAFKKFLFDNETNLFKLSKHKHQHYWQRLFNRKHIEIEVVNELIQTIRPEQRLIIEGEKIEIW